MRHVTQALLAGAGILETKGDDDDPVAVVTKALGDLTKSVGDQTKSLDDRLKAIETKAADDGKKLTDRLDKIEAKAKRPGGSDKQDDPDAEVVRKSFGTYLRLGNQTPVEDIKALTVSSDPQAGYLAPAEMSTEFIKDLVEFSPIRSYASVRTTGATSVKYPKRTGITNAQWEGELEESEESDISFGLTEVEIHKLTTFVDISNELLADSAGQAEQEVRLALAEDFGQKEAVAFVNGSGVKQPAGLMSDTGILHTVNGHATNLSADKLIDLMYALPAAYRNASGAAWALNGTTLAAVRKLKDGQNNYLWQPSYQVGQPETILGKPVIEMVDMPDIADGAFPIIYGDFSAYRIVDRLALSVLSDPYTQARKGVTRIHATRRTGGRVLQTARFRKLKTATS
ncbi:phage major capsid protein [Mesorhizobium sp. J428]|uniref:phage major capsid protein n=1 Tax=Mesorhizobium sp. J428 TaxID=2898440 RepID=UPI00215108D2|nr:phage major capsid protein [Mesorhizobium sp. J428]MCR5856569.1 phage major capsid protein [Mesorhizobium sp. J428]